MKNKSLLKLVVPISLITALAVALPLAGGCTPKPAPEVEPVVIGFIGSVDSDYGRSCMRGGEILCDELNEAGGILGGRPIKYVKADTGMDVLEGVKAYDYLCEVEGADFIISSSIDDVSMAWMPRLAVHRVPTMDTWTTAIGAIELVRNDYETYKSYFMSNPNDYFYGYEYTKIAKEIFVEELGYETCVIFREDTVFAAGVGGFVEEFLAPEAGIEILDTVVYDIETVDYGPLYSKIVDMDPDFIFQISSVNSVPPTAQYIELEIPIMMAGINCAVSSAEYWDDMGRMGAGIITFHAIPIVGMDLSPESQEFLETYQARYTTRPSFPHFNAFTSYYEIGMAVDAAERVYTAGLGPGFEPLDAWVEEFLKEDRIIYKDGEVWLRFSFYGPGEVDPLLGEEMTHNIRIDPKGEEGLIICCALQWYEDGTPGIIYPAKYATSELALPSWVTE